MNNRRLSYGLLLALSTALVAGCGEPATPEVPPQPTAAPEVPAPPPAALSAAPAPAPVASAEPAPAPAPAAKPAKEKWVGKFAQDFQGEVKDAFEADATKKFAKEKDTKKHDEAAKKAMEAVAQNTIDNTADTHTFSVKGKAVHTIKYEVAKDEATSLTLKLGNDSTAKKDLKGAEITVTFIDDNTFSVKDPFAKDPKKAQTLVFKRQ
jgi:type IV secretory pathway VirB10-like protein